MYVLEYYIDLKRRKEFREVHQIHITKQEIASILFCSSRNVHHILNRWIENGYVDWRSQRGRGKKSTLTFLVSLEDAAILHVEQLIQKERVKEAMTFAVQSDLSNELNMKLLSIIQEAFGIQHIDHRHDRQDILHIPLQHGLSNMNPFFVTIATEAHILNEVFDTLVRYNVDTKTVEPHLAHGWDSNEDYTIWTFYIRKGIQFHNGRILTSRDVKWTFDSLLHHDVHVPNKWLLEDIEEITASNIHTISFHLCDKNRMLPNFLSAIFTSIIPYGTDITSSSLKGTGPYLVDQINDQRIVLKAFDNCFKGRAFLDKVQMWSLPEGNFDPLYFFTNDKAGENKSEGTTFTIHDNGSNYLIFNMKKQGPQQCTFFKKAVSELIDSREMVQELGGPREAASTSFIPERSNYSQNHSIEKARKLLDRSSYCGETLKIATLRFEDFLQDAQWMKDKLSKLGIQVDIHPIELSDIYNEELMLSFHAVYTGEGFEDNLVLSLLILLRNEYGIRRFLNNSQLEELDEGFYSIKKQSDYDRCIQEFQLVEEKLKEDGTLIFTVHASDQNTFQSNLQGIKISGYGWPVFHELWVK